MNLLTLKALMHTLKKLARDFLMQEIARTRSSSCKNLHQLASNNENLLGILFLKIERQKHLVLGNAENNIFAK